MEELVQKIKAKLRARDIKILRTNKMKKIQFYVAAITLAVIALLAVVSFVIVFIGFSMNTFTSIDLGALTGFDVAFWLAGRLLAPVVRDCYNEWQEENHTNKINDVKLQ